MPAELYDARDWPHRLSARTRPSHGRKRGSIPRGVIQLGTFSFTERFGSVLRLGHVGSMTESWDTFSSRQRRALEKAVEQGAFDAHQTDTLEEYTPGKTTIAERLNNSDVSALEQSLLLTDIFERRKNSILETIRSVHTNNLASVTSEDIREAMAQYENGLDEMERVRSNLAGYFRDRKGEVLLAGGSYHIVSNKESFFELLAEEIHEELFERTEFFKNVSGVVALRTNEKGQTEVLLVRSKKTGIWQFPGGKAEHVSEHPRTGKKEIVTDDGDIWRFADGTEAAEDAVALEKPDECLRREISEELGEDVGDVRLHSSGFYSIGNSRFLIHGFVANNLSVDPAKINPEEIDRILWTSDPMGATEDDGTAIKFTDQTKDVLQTLFQKRGAE